MARLREKAGTVANQADQIQQAVCATIRTEIGALRAFVDRRIAELSAEVHATSDLMDFSETNLSGQLKGIREQIANVVAMPTAATRNSGLELEAVVQQTEAAANRIMEAAEAIGDWLRDGKHDAASIDVGEREGQCDLRGLLVPGRHRPADQARDPAFATGRNHADRSGAERRGAAVGRRGCGQRAVQQRGTGHAGASRDQSRYGTGCCQFSVRLARSPNGPQHRRITGTALSSRCGPRRFVTTTSGIAVHRETAPCRRPALGRVNLPSQSFGLVALTCNSCMSADNGEWRGT